MKLSAKFDLRMREAGNFVQLALTIFQPRGPLGVLRMGGTYQLYCRLKGLQSLDFILSFSEHLHFNYVLVYKDSLHKFEKKFFIRILPTLPLNGVLKTELFLTR